MVRGLRRESGIQRGDVSEEGVQATLEGDIKLLLLDVTCEVLEFLKYLGVNAHAALVLAVCLTILFLLIYNLLHVVDDLFLLNLNVGRLIIIVLLKSFFSLDDFNGLIFLVSFEMLAFLVACLDRGIVIDVFYTPTF